MADANGIAFFDASDPRNPRFLGTQEVDGVVWDLTFGGSALFAANDLGLAVISRVFVPPAIAPSQIGIGGDGSATATVTGATWSVSPEAAAIEIRNLSSGATATTRASTTGTFSTSIAARPGEPLSLAATDSAGRAANRVIGSPPFVTIVRSDPAIIPGDASFRARRAASDGSSWFVTNGSVAGQNPGGSSRALLFVQPDASAPPQVSAIDFGAGTLLDAAAAGGYGIVVGNRLASIGLAAGAVHFAASDPCGRELAVAVDGTTAFTAESDCSNNGTIHVYDLSNPAAPIYVRSQAMAGVSGVAYRALLVMGSRYLVAITPDAPAGIGSDVTVIDRADLNNLTRVSVLDIPGFAAFTGAIDGSTLYLAGGDAGIAIVDLVDPASPRWTATVDTPGLARSVAVLTPNEVVVADAGGPGLTFLDTSDRMRPIVLGSQPLVGNAVDVKVVGGRIFVATETRSYVVIRP